MGYELKKQNKTANFVHVGHGGFHAVYPVTLETSVKELRVSTTREETLNMRYDRTSAELRVVGTPNYRNTLL